VVVFIEMKEAARAGRRWDKELLINGHRAYLG
jgi:hypothetical protein